MKKNSKRIRIAIQKSGRLNEGSLDCLTRCGLTWDRRGESLITSVNELEIDLLFVRDDDIPSMVMSGVCDLGIVGQNTLEEKRLSRQQSGYQSAITQRLLLGFSSCRLAFAVPSGLRVWAQSLNGARVATSYPNLVAAYAQAQSIKIECIEINGSVEIAPSLGMADVICDLVSSGRTLEENNLTETVTLMKSQAVLIQSDTLESNAREIVDLLVRRIEGVMKARRSKLICFHAPRQALDSITPILPGIESPTILPLPGDDDRVSVSAVSEETVFWETLEAVKANGASSILVLPIEKMMQ